MFPQKFHSLPVCVCGDTKVSSLNHPRDFSQDLVKSSVESGCKEFCRFMSYFQLCPSTSVSVPVPNPNYSNLDLKTKY